MLSLKTVLSGAALSGLLIFGGCVDNDAPPVEREPAVEKPTPAPAPSARPAPQPAPQKKADETDDEGFSIEADRNGGSVKVRGEETNTDVEVDDDGFKVKFGKD